MRVIGFGLNKRVVSAGRLALGVFLLSLVVFSLKAAPLETSPASHATLSVLLNEERLSLNTVRINDKDYIGVEQVARLSQAQIRWQPVTEQVCLSNAEGLLCFNWALDKIFLDSHPLKNDYPLHAEENQLFVPLDYIQSDNFQSYSRSEISWNSRDRELLVRGYVDLRIPQVEKMADRYRLVLDVSPVMPHYLIEKNKGKVWVRFMGARTEGSEILEGDTVIKEIRVVQKKHSADLILKTGDDAVSNDVYFEDGKKKLVIDIFTSAKVPRAVAEPKIVSVPPASIAPSPAHGAHAAKGISFVAKSAVPATVALKNRIPISPAKEKTGARIVVIDAGHGGQDCGAIGVRGTFEKDINLSVAKELAKQLAKEKNFRTVLTRERDELIPLGQRTEIANKSGGDLFVSIHCNSSLSSKNTGTEAYFLSPEATDKAAEAVARLENSVVSLEAHKGTTSSRLEQVLASMAVYDFINESSKFATLICRSLRAKSNVDRTEVKEADFFVLRGAQMPSVLVELEYLSNASSEARLRSSRYRSRLIKGIVDGILAYDRQIRQEQGAVASQIREATSRMQR